MPFQLDIQMPFQLPIQLPFQMSVQMSRYVTNCLSNFVFIQFYKCQSKYLSNSWSDWLSNYLSMCVSNCPQNVFAIAYPTLILIYCPIFLAIVYPIVVVIVGSNFFLSSSLTKCLSNYLFVQVYYQLSIQFPLKLDIKLFS